MRTFFLTLAAVGFTAGLLSLFGQEKKGTQYAFLVACAQYQNGLPALDHTVKERKEYCVDPPKPAVTLPLFI